MALKRKASFSSPSPNRDSTSFLPGGVVPMVDENPRHLHSRTRKRFRNDRPDDQTVYDNTLRWLFSAQKNAAASSPAVDESDAETPSLFSSNMVDPSQHSLRKFFQPAPVNRPSSNMGNAPNSFHNQSIHGKLPNQMDDMDCTDDTSGSSSGYGTMDVEMDMEVDMTGGCGIAAGGHPSEKKWVGGIGWI